MNIRTTRRRFIVVAGTLLGSLSLGRKLLGIADLDARRVDAAPTVVDGFVMVGENDPAPSTCVPTGAPPVMEHMPDGPAINARYEEFVDAASLAKNVGFPIYDLAKTPQMFSPGPIYAIRNARGQVDFASVGYNAQAPDTDLSFNVLSISATEVYLSPMPIRPSRIDGQLYAADQVEFLPNSPKSGVHVVSAEGHNFYWFEQGILYWLRAEFRGDYASAKDIVQQLTKVA